MKDYSSQLDRSIRVFISSTFRDMQEERDVLMKFTFPKVRKLCEERGVIFTDVDLRWGITEEQAQRGEVLAICLAEIERCRPFFIGLLGERYGWVPNDIPNELIEQHPWLAEHRNKSVTELEIIHGVLANPKMANRACFYFRDPTYRQQLSQAQRASYVEQEPAARDALILLKERIRASDVAWRDNYPDPEALGEWVLQDLTTAINQQFPAESTPDPLDRETFQHEAFGRCRTSVYIGRQEYFDALDRHVASNDEPLVILGESGQGKSALLANWVKRFRNSHPTEFVIQHYIGATADSSNWAAMLRRVLGEWKRRFDLALDVPQNPHELRATFAKWLPIAAARGRVVLVIDALNQLDDRERALDLVWLPQVVPQNVRLIVSTLPGPPQNDLAKRGWPTLTVQPLTVDERTQLIQVHLRQYTKSLSP